MKDIEAYMLLTFYAPKLNMSKDLVLKHLNEKKVMPLPMELHEMDAILNFAPPIKYIIKSFKDAGYSVTWIAEHLKIPQPNVSYHLRTVPKQEWVSQSWQYIRQMKRKQQMEAQGYDVL